MHYNLHERLKPKKHMPYKKILLLCAVILIAIAVYVLVFHTGTPDPAPVKANLPA